MMAKKFKDKTKPHYKPTPESRTQVNAMAAYGVPEHAIAAVLKIDPKTLRKYFREELDTAHTKANSAVAQSLYRKATGEGPQSVTAAIFWLKTRMGWRETSGLQLSGDADSPIVHKIGIDAQFDTVVGALEDLARAKQGGAGVESGMDTKGKTEPTDA